ncbi:hypothetical protein O7626_40285 [Micromonospora sp. WMMD1102]|uniref:hypothetical protein n=1 Tax=Micromonospora sp. WMMD1102 TaxID=3016105 RepID=UPI002414DE24|nr:hypothetical protein [Micromonospora sp. WMMD1102]MDG4792057.1 hypothetical protein [Micromonospora sp. WMMD1102]
MTEKPKTTDRHRNPSMALRPDPELRERGAKVLDDNNWNMTEFFESCLEVLLQNPDAMLKRLGQVRRTRKKGRPPKPKT